MRTRLVVVLPGGGYGPQGAALRFPLLALEQLGHTDSTVVSYPAVVAGTPDASSMLVEAAADQVLPAIRESQADEVVFLAKSLGTRALAGIAHRLPPDRLVSAIWLTPLFRAADVRELAAQSGLRSLLVAGDADPYHDADGFEQVGSALEASKLIIERADHALEVPGDVGASIGALTALTAAVLDFYG